MKHLTRDESTQLRTAVSQVLLVKQLLKSLGRPPGLRKETVQFVPRKNNCTHTRRNPKQKRDEREDGNMQYKNTF
jgi:hypothetical protein